ncbi:Cobalamin synthase [Candidatus Syntrophocurvum alkaliphilum]|uniref:Adenosylcobinamide-GDP ribazoletransferase n=1 Tax=Candidatus Syntrophocurvum alkaliphilum TaxID=2293317 RepID=A0A6I6DDQ4_9FIRM|nr:adenosylcobinamide-GDP ribazoletransferase [Candidatus Syntrophocurvum alkaliphilum]QGU00260.1 Cobalamin synthase [Candidatus Syntrophocurvum alkaliphilum]
MLKSFISATTFLTTIPIKEKRIATEKELANSLYFYPIVGFIIGSILCMLIFLTEPLSLGLAGHMIILTIWILLTGGLHLDGLMDSADGLLSHREQKQKLEIMHDSRVGAMGAIALVIILLLKLSALNSLMLLEYWWVLLLAPAMGRTAIVFVIWIFPYARKEPGLGSVFGKTLWYKPIIALIILLIGTIFSAGYLGIMIIIITLALALLIALWINQSLGGHTGDTYGAMCEVTETVFLLLTIIILKL